MRLPRFVVFACGAGLVFCVSHGLAQEPLNVTARAMFGAYGGLSAAPVDPNDPERFFAEVVVEVSSAAEVRNVSVADLVTDFSLVNDTGTTGIRRVVSVHMIDLEVLDRWASSRPRPPGECGYWRRPEGATAWNGTLPSGVILLRIRVALAAKPARPDPDDGSYRVVIGQHVVEGPIRCVWAQ